MPPDKGPDDGRGHQPRPVGGKAAAIGQRSQHGKNVKRSKVTAASGQTAAAVDPADLQQRDLGLQRAVRLAVVQEFGDEIGHDLNNVLTVIAGSLQLYLMQQGGETAEHRFIRNAIDAALRGAQMSGRLLAYASPEAADNRPVDLCARLTGLEPMLREQLGSALALTVKLAPGVPHTTADPRFIDTTLLELAQHARRQPVRAGTFTVAVAAADASMLQRSASIDPARSFLLLTVACSAPGVSHEPVVAALTPRFDTRAPTQSVDVTAVDLAACYAAIRQCGGDIDVEPVYHRQKNGPQQPNGFTVSILLPVE